MQPSGSNLAEVVANSLSEGANCLHAIIQDIDNGKTDLEIAPCGWDSSRDALEAMEWALEVVQAGRLQTGMVVMQEDVDNVGRLRDLIARDESAPDLRALAQTCMDLVMNPRHGIQPPP